jgi:spermidine dehydrogenase
VADLPTERRDALNQFFFAPMLMVNVALRNWRFLDKLGFSAARWFDGIGFFGIIRQPMLTGGAPAPFHPDKPIIMTLYVPFPHPELPLEAQGPAGRAQLYTTSYADYERQIVQQMVRMFAAGGFDARRDIAGIVLNRWGHAFVTPPPGFFFGKDGQPAPVKVAAQPLGRIAFAQTGLEGWLGAAQAGKRAIAELSQFI